MAKDRFQATGSDGQEYTILMTAVPPKPVHHFEQTPPVARDRRQAGKLQIVDGREVLRLGKGLYQIRCTSIILRSDDPEAP
jgi:hypothetical protein